MPDTRRMEKPIDLLPRVSAELGRRRGNLRQIAKDTGISYDTLARIRDQADNSPSYSKVRDLYEYLFHTKVEA